MQTAGQAAGAESVPTGGRTEIAKTNGKPTSDPISLQAGRAYYFEFEQSEVRNSTGLFTSDETNFGRLKVLPPSGSAPSRCLRTGSGPWSVIRLPSSFGLQRAAASLRFRAMA